MYDTKIHPMSLNGDTFNAMKSDFDLMLRKLIMKMEKFECEDATLTIKLAVKLEKGQARDFQSNGYDGMRDIVKPTFKHEILSAMQIKDKKDGSLSGNYELVWDKENSQYVMKNIDDGQITFSDCETRSADLLAFPTAEMEDYPYEMPSQELEEP